MAEALRLQLTGIRKAFGATLALDGVDLAVRPGEAHALIGENGAGKSTLMKVLSGIHRPDAGQLWLDGVPFVPGNPVRARRAGVVMVHQELAIAPELSVLANITLGAEPAYGGWLAPTAATHTAIRACQRLGVHLPLEAQAGTLPIAQQQLVELARALTLDPRVLVLDEPTSALGRGDIEHLFAAIDRLREDGVSVIYISHFLEECRRLCRSFTVLRDGRSVATGTLDTVSETELIRHMVGRDVEELYPRIPHTPGEAILELRNIAGDDKPRRASCTLHRGEIFGLFGLVGAGRTETLRCAFGLDPIHAGSVTLCGRDHRPAPRRSWSAGMGMLSEDRKDEGLLLALPIADNITLTTPGAVGRGGFLSRKRQHQASTTWIERLGIRCRDPGQNVSELSGGNQQKVALARLLQHDCDVLLLDEPTRGIDVGAKATIYRCIGELAASGKAVLMVSSYLPELLGICDTVAAFDRGVMGRPQAVSQWSRDSLLAAAIGTAAEEAR